MARKILIGCGALFGLLVAAILVAYLVFMSWVRAAPPPLDGRALAGPATRFVLLYAARKEDPQAVELVRFLVAEAAKAGKVEENVQGLVRHLGYPDLPAFGEDLLPITMGLAVEEDGTTISFVSFSKYANLIRQGLAKQLDKRGPPVGEKDGTPIYQEADGRFGALRANTRLWARSRPALEAALGRLSGAAPASLPVLSRLEAASPLSASLVDQGGFVERVLERARDERGRSLKDSLADIRLGAEDVTWGRLAGTLGKEKLSGTIQLGLERPGRGAEIRDSTRRLLEEFVRHFLREELKLEHQSRLEQDALSVTFSLDGLDRYWRKAARE